jgi:autotransporter-associated beta strand protein
MQPVLLLRSCCRPSNLGLFTALLLLALPLASALGQIPAFPGAEGFGAYATGGRGGDVYYVVNLNSSGAGSFRYGVETAPSQGRTIVFAVSGYIPINYNSDTGNQTVRIVQNKVRVAGQTAPGDGIALKDGRILVTGDNVVIQHLRIRHGDGGGAGDCVNLDNGVTNLMLDHISMAFSTDENLSSFEQDPRPDLISFQWSLNAWGLESHSCGGLWDLQRVTTHHTLWAHHHTRNPKARPYGLLDWINNVTFDWDIGFIMGDSTTPAPWKANVRGNYFVCPPGNLRSVALEKASLDRNGNYNYTLHVATNLFDKNGNNVLDGSDYGYGIASGSYQVSNSPIVVAGAQVPVTIDPPLTAYKKIVSSAGPLRLDALANISLRDELDAILVSNLVTLKRNHVSSETGTGASNNGFGFLNSTPAPLDTDLDGMPDFWEQSLGWASGSQDHNTALASSGGFITGLTFFPPNTVAGYTRLEEYLYFLTIPHATIGKNTTNGASSLTVDLRKFVSGFNKAPVTFTLSNATNGTAVLQPDGYTAVFTPTLDFFGRARFNFAVTDGDGSTWTQTLGVLVSGMNVPRNLKWEGDGSANLWNTNTLNFLHDASPAAFAPGDNVLFDDTGFNTPAVALGFTLTPGLVEVNASQDYTLGGNGSLAGAMKIVKDGSGTLTLASSNNTFSGGIELLDGGVTLATTNLVAGTGPILLNGGLLTLTAPGGPAQYANPVTVASPSTVRVLSSGNVNQAFSGALSGSGNLTFDIGSGGTFSPRSGMTMSGYSGTILLAGPGFFRWQGGTGSSTVAFDLGANGNMLTRDGGTITLGSLTGGTGSFLRGAGSTATATTYVIGGKNTSTTFAGTITNGVVGGVPVSTAITKLGTGTLTLTGTNNYTGTTSVGAGTLVINGNNGSSAVVVSNGATLGGSGIIGGTLTANNGGKIAPGNSAGTLNLAGGLTLNSASLNFELANVTTPGGGVNDLIAMAGGTLTLSGTSVVDPSFLNGSLANGSYTLISGGSFTVGSAANLSWGGAAGGRQTFGFATSTPGTVQLVVGGSPAANLVWRGFVNGNWDTATFNWLNGGGSDRFYNLDTAVFDDTGLSAPNVTFVGNLTPAGVTVNSSGTYTFNGPGALTGPGTLTKAGSGTLHLNLTNSSFPGNVHVSGGTLNMQGAGSKLNTGNLILSGGGIFNLPPSSPAYFYAGTITVLAGQTGTIYSPGLGNGIDGNLISGSSNSVLNISSGVSFRGTTSAQFDGFTGIINILPGSTLRFSDATSGNTFGSLNPTFIIDGALRPRNAGNTVRLGALSGAGSIEGPQSNAGTGNTTYIIGGNNLDVTFNGNISSNSAVPGSLVILNKVGAGKLTLNGSSTFTGGTTVEAGSLIVNNASGTGTGAGGLSIAGGATLGGTGFIGSPTSLEDFAILAPGNSAGTLTFNDDLDFGEFSILNFELGTSSDAVVANGALTLQGTLNVSGVAGFGAGNYTLFTYNPAQTFNYSGLNLGTLPAGYSYSISTGTPGQVKLIVTPATPPSFNPPLYSGGNLILSGTGGTPGADHYVLSSTNVALPLVSWQVEATNQFDGSGNFAYTNAVNANTPQRFFRLQVP